MGAGVSLSRRRPRRCVRTAGICQINVQMLLAVSPFASRCWRASPSPVPKMPNSPSSALLNSNGGQTRNDHLRGAPGWSEGKRQKGLSDGFQIVAIFRHRKVRRCPSPAALFSETAARRRSACLPSAAATHGKWLGKSLAKKGGGLPAWSKGCPDDENSRRRTRYLHGSHGRRRPARACLNGESAARPTVSSQHR